jgi:Protein of unknown function (DUF3124)
MSHRVLVVLFSIVVIGAIWAMRPMINSQKIPVVSAAWAQTAADHPASFIGSLAELPPPERLKIRRSVYVASYSTVRLGGGKGKVDLATTLSIHNTSEETGLVLIRVDYFDTAGNLLQRYLADPIAIRPLATVQTFVPAEDTRGGTGASFVVEWVAAEQITKPLIEAVMVGTLGAQGFSFTSRGKSMTIGPTSP